MVVLPQALASLCIVQVALLLNVMYRPYDYAVQDRLETISLATTFFTLIAGLYFVSAQPTPGCNTAFASCVPLPSWLRHRLCLVFHCLRG